MNKPVCCPVCRSEKIHLYNAAIQDWPPGSEMGVVLGEEYTGGYSWDFIVVAYECENKHGFYVDAEEKDEDD